MAQKESVHSKQLTAAARSVLRPMGLVQKGRSRIWLDDHQWWVCVVEFQPSSSSRGSYLNVGCMWLWGLKSYISFDEGYRVGSFVSFQNEEQFEQAATQLAERASHEVARYRMLFPNMNALCEYYLLKDIADGWSCYHVAIACALVNKVDTARALFKRFEELTVHNKVMAGAQEDSRFLASLVGTHRLREVLANRVLETRETQKLPAIAFVNFE